MHASSGRFQAWMEVLSVRARTRDLATPRGPGKKEILFLMKYGSADTGTASVRRVLIIIVLSLAESSFSWTCATHFGENTKLYPWLG